MSDLSGTIKELIEQRDNLNQAIAALEGLTNGASRKGPSGKRNMSAAGRARIAAAQRARWAKFRSKRKKAA
jgi:hypothetical protein